MVSVPIYIDHLDILSFVTKALWTLVRHWFIPTMGDNILNPDRDTLVVRIMECFQINISQIIV